MILVDDREPLTLRTKIRTVCRDLSIPCDEGRFKSGDVLLDTPAGMHAIERKTVADWWKSYCEKRIQRQLSHLCEYDQPYLLLEGYPQYDPFTGKLLLGGRVTNCSFNTLHSFLHDTQARGIRTGWTGGLEQTVLWIVGLYQRLQRPTGKERDALEPVIKRSARIARPDIGVLMMVPGVGEKVASQLLAHYPSVASIIAADDQALRQVPGVGPSTVGQLRTVLGRGVCSNSGLQPSQDGSGSSGSSSASSSAASPSASSKRTGRTSGSRGRSPRSSRV
jgi:ERCC4-type nuclease